MKNRVLIDRNLLEGTINVLESFGSFMMAQAVKNAIRSAPYAVIPIYNKDDMKHMELTVSGGMGSITIEHITKE